MQLLLIRHGESTANAAGRVQGRLDSPLSERGREEGRRLAQRLVGADIAALYSSPLLRARQTADLIAEALGLTPVERAALMEYDVGELGGLTVDEARARVRALAGERAPRLSELDIPGMEPYGAFTGRVLTALDEIVAAHAGQTVAVVTHGGVLGVICRHVLGLPLDAPVSLRFANTSITTVEVRDDGQDSPATPRFRLVGLNDVCHLEGM